MLLNSARKRFEEKIGTESNGDERTGYELVWFVTDKILLRGRKGYRDINE